MKIKQVTMTKLFEVEHEGKTYYVDFTNSTGQTLALLNREAWQITDEDDEELQIYSIGKPNKKQKAELKKAQNLFDELAEYCCKHFNDYDKKLEKY